MPTSQEMRVQRTFDKAMDQINNLQKVFRDEGMLAKAVVDIGGDQDFGAIQEAFDNLYGALEDGNYDALAHLAVESAKQKLGMTEENKTIKPQGKQAEIDLAGDSIWDRQGENPAKVYVMSITIENPYEPGGYMDDDEDDGYRKVDVEHNGPWTIYTDSGFAEGISGLVGFPVDFTEQGMQEDGMASLESTMDDAMESVQEGKLTEGYESKVLKICKDEGIDCSFKDGKLHLDKEDMAKAKKALKDDEDIKELPDMVAESVAETNTDDDARKEQSLELTRLKQLIGTDTIREMKQ
tara:strand:- start:2475 stop:3359 length:885 start_codon:yes stop_codon:yes gene_type:complete